MTHTKELNVHSHISKIEHNLADTVTKKDKVLTVILLPSME